MIYMYLTSPLSPYGELSTPWCINYPGTVAVANKKIVDEYCKSLQTAGLSGSRNQLLLLLTLILTTLSQLTLCLQTAGLSGSRSRSRSC